MSLKIPSISGGGIIVPATLPFFSLAINVERPGPEKKFSERVLQHILFFTLAMILFPPVLPIALGELGGGSFGVAANAPTLKSKNGEFGGMVVKLFAGTLSKFSTNVSIKNIFFAGLEGA